MGLDTVELVMEIEDAFSITIPDDEAARLVTVGDLFDYIAAETSVPANSSVCLAAIAFYTLRRAAASLGVAKRLRPRDAVTSIFPDSRRVEYWSQLQSRSGLKLPSLRRPEWLVGVCTVPVVSGSIFLGCLAYLSTDSGLAGFAAAALAGTVLGLIAEWLTKPFAVFPASHCTTLRGLAESALRMNFKTLTEPYNGANANDLWITLRAIIVEELGVSPEEVTPGASFVNDLGCG